MKAKLFFISAAALLAVALPTLAQRPSHSATAGGARFAGGNHSVATSGRGNARGPYRGGNYRGGYNNYRGGYYGGGNYRGGYYRHRGHGYYGGPYVSFSFGSGFYGYPYGGGYYPYYGGYYPYGYGYYPYGGYGAGYGYDSNSYSERVYAGRPYASGNGNLIARVQAKLAREGYYRGTVDGMLGPRTNYAIRAYEGRHGLPVDGRIDRRLLNELDLS